MNILHRRQMIRLRAQAKAELEAAAGAVVGVVEKGAETALQVIETAADRVKRLRAELAAAEGAALEEAAAAESAQASVDQADAKHALDTPPL